MEETRIITEAERYGPIEHALVRWTENGERRSAYVNPDLYAAHGLAALDIPNWHKGKPATNDT